MVLRQLEREVGDRAAALDGDLLLVVDVLDEAGEAEHVFGHALAPLPTGLAARQRLAQALRGVGEVAGLGRVELELLAHLAERHLAGAVRSVSWVSTRASVAPTSSWTLPEPGLDQRLLRFEVGLRRGGLGAQRLAVEHGGLLEGGVDRGVALHGGLRAGLVEQAASVRRRLLGVGGSSATEQRDQRGGAHDERDDGHHDGGNEKSQSWPSS